MMDRERLVALIEAVADAVTAHADELTALDQAIGDGDHGFNMKRGFEAVRTEARSFADKPLPDALKAIGTLLVMKVGGASGCSDSTAGGGSFRCMFTSARALSATNGSAPVSIRKRITPNE